MALQLNFSLALVKHKTRTRNSSYKSIEKDVEGIVRLKEDGDYVIIVGEKEYKLEKESLSTVNKKNLYVFNKKSYPNFIINYKYNKEDVHIERGFPFMTVHPGLIVKGTIVSDVVRGNLFKIIKNIEKIDPKEHSSFRKNAIVLIDAYNVKHNIFTDKSK